MPQKYFTLSAVTRRIGELLEPALSKTFWVKAEVSSAAERGGALYCDLVESDAAGKVRAQMRCTIWPRELAAMRARFHAAGLGLELREGSVVGVECRVQFHPRYGLSLSGLDMDPALALGEIELRRRRILESLTRDGLLERNASLPVPLLPNRIALVTSAASAACADFVETVMGSGFGFRIYLADTAVQGEEAEAGILASLDAAARLRVDLVVLVRGGGTRTDLGWLDNEVVARAIAALPIPVWTGIGHEVDRSVLDEVASRAFKTPTGVADELLARFSRVEGVVSSARRQLRSLWQLRREHEGHFLAHAHTGLRQGSRKLLELSTARLRGAASELRSRVRVRLGSGRAQLAALRARLESGALGRLSRAALQRTALRGRFQPRVALRRLEAERAALSQRERMLRASDPEQALARGFSLVYSAAGDLVRSVDDVRAGESTLTRLSDGQLESVVQKVSGEEDD